MPLLSAADLRAALCIGSGFLALLAVAEAWSRLGGAKPEWTRKLVHMAGGLICLSFPFVVQSTRTVLLLATLMTFIFVVGAETKLLHSLYRVKRRSRGCEYYPIAVCLVFFLTQERPWFYVSSMLVLAVADAGAALIGMRYGRIRYVVEDETKSLEGSLAFLAIALAAILAPLLAMSGLDPATCVFSALLVAIVVTGFEAICLTGTDNLFVPLATCVILSKITTKPLSEILYQNLSLLGVFGLIAALSWRVRSLNVGGAVLLALASYGAWSLGSEWWGAPALAGFVLYIVACARWPLPEVQKVRVVFRAILIPIVLLVAANMLGWEEQLYVPFVAAVLAVMGLSVWNHIRVWRAPPQDWNIDRLWSLRHLVITAAAALLAGVLQAGGLIPSWSGL